MQSAERNVYEQMDLSGKVAIVTGAAGWLGSAMSRSLAEAGARLVVTSRSAAQAEAFAASLPGEGHSLVWASRKATAIAFPASSPK